ncbi:MAG: metallophosphoesterase [Saprospiraceae bacterium]|nr:metallophosphoesterase [Saprospiraceae bacterium]
MRLFIFLSLLLVIDLYAFQAFRIFSQSWSRFPRVSMVATYLILSLVAYLYVIGSSNHWFEGVHKNINIYLRAFVFILFFSKFFVAIFVGIDDLRRLLSWFGGQFSSGAAPDLSRSRFLAHMGLIVGALPFISLTYGILRNTYRYKLHRQPMRIKNLPRQLAGLKIVQISDIHSGSFTFKDPIRRGIEIINALKPDLVFFTGDLVNTHAKEMEPYTDVFDKIQAKYGVYSILGNHDYGDYRSWPTHHDKENNFAALKDVHKQMGWNLLLNEHRKIDIDGTTLAVIGVENISGSNRFVTYGNLQQAYQGAEDADLKILLSHDPSHWSSEVIKLFRDIKITLSGHTHGFQFGIEIPGWVKWSPSKYVYKHWAGLYHQHDQHLYVNRGFGVLGYPGRVGILPEITLLELEPAT